MSTPFQDWLRQYINDSSISNAECAKRFGVHESLITYYLKGTRQPTYSTLQKIKWATDVDLNQLFLDSPIDGGEDSRAETIQ